MSTTTTVPSPSLSDAVTAAENAVTAYNNAAAQTAADQAKLAALQQTIASDQSSQTSSAQSAVTALPAPPPFTPFNPTTCLPVATAGARRCCQVSLPLRAVHRPSPRRSPSPNWRSNRRGAQCPTVIQVVRNQEGCPRRVWVGRPRVKCEGGRARLGPASSCSAIHRGTIAQCHARRSESPPELERRGNPGSCVLER